MLKAIIQQLSMHGHRFSYSHNGCKYALLGPHYGPSTLIVAYLVENWECTGTYWHMEYIPTRTDPHPTLCWELLFKI